MIVCNDWLDVNYHNRVFFIFVDFSHNGQVTTNRNLRYHLTEIMARPLISRASTKVFDTNLPKRVWQEVVTMTWKT
jgi:hypothetical protein